MKQNYYKHKLTKLLLSMGSVLLISMLIILKVDVIYAQSDISVPTGKFVGEYYNGRDFNTFIYSEETDQVKFGWGNGSPSESINANNFSVRWRGNFFFEEGVYEFSVKADDGIRVYIDNNLIINRWVHQLAVVQKVKTNILGGAHQVRVEYYESSGGASVSVEWVRIGEIINNGNSSSTTNPTNNSGDSVSEVECVRLDASPQEGAVPLAVNFSAVYKDPKTQIIEYEFSFGETVGGEVQVVKQSSSNSSHTYERIGYYTASVQAKDNLGNLIGGRGGSCEITINAKEQVLTDEEDGEEEDEENEPDVLVANDANELPDTGAFDYLLAGLSVIYAVTGAYLFKRFGVVR
jgi:hypothetical protein